MSEEGDIDGYTPAFWRKLREDQWTRDRENHQNLKRIADSLEKLGDRLEKLTDSMMKVGEIVSQGGAHGFGVGVPADEDEDDEPDGTTSEAVFLDLLKVVEKPCRPDDHELVSDPVPGEIAGAKNPVITMQSRCAKCGLVYGRMTDAEVRARVRCEHGAWLDLPCPDCEAGR